MGQGLRAKDILSIADLYSRSKPQLREVWGSVHHRWRKEYGGLKSDQAKRLKEHERENTRLKRLLAEALLPKELDP